MRRAAVIFLAAILLPCLALAWLAVRSEQDQQVILQHQQAIIDQGVADSLAQNVRAQMDAVISDFVGTSQHLLTAAGSPETLADGFHEKLCSAWPLADVGFAVDMQGTIYAPSRTDGRAARLFREENASFLSNRADAEVYLNTQNQLLNTQNQFQIVQKAPPVLTASSGNAQPSAATVAPATEAATPPGAEGKMESEVSASAGTSAPMAQSLRAQGALTSESDAFVDSDKLRSTDSSKLQQQADLQQKLVRDQLASTKKSAVMDQNVPAAPIPTAAASASTPPAPAAAPAPPPEVSTEPVAAEASIQVPNAASELTEKATSAKGAAARSLDVGMTANAAPVIPAPAAAPAPSQVYARIARKVAPQETTRAPDAVLSNVVPAQSDFRQLIGQSTSGSVARFVDDKLSLLVWSVPSNGSIVFGAQLDQKRLIDRLQALVTPEANRSSLDSSYGARADYCLVLLDDKGEPVAQSQSGFKTDWKHPFVATEIGSVLPHWEAALYLTDPRQVSHSARVLHFTIWLIIAVLIVAILAGGTLIGADVGRQMRLAQQKTDFVSNVSHELKTPLTSIRMFADMLAEGRVEEPERQSTYLRIISAESARLTRLINNVLDFARLERGAPSGERHACDLVEVTRDVVETCRPHLETSGVSLALEIEAESLPLLADRDALSQIVLNLVSNAEKYGGGDITVRVRRQEMPAGAIGCVDVLDRGPGIPPKQVESVFAPFHRLNDSLASGVPGSGLGLTLARRMARAHGGNVTYQPRAGGGSCFTLALPLTVSAIN